jgi:C1A family cysteine protease
MSGLIERNPFVNLSEWHLGYFTYNGDYPMDMYDSSSSSDAFYSKGGSASFATATLSRWNGPVSESLVSYGSTDVDDSLNYASEYHLTDAVCMNSSLNDNIMYNNYQNNIKSIVLSGKSVMVSLYYKYNLYYSKAGNSYYCNDSSLTINHGVTIVGWMTILTTSRA